MPFLGWTLDMVFRTHWIWLFRLIGFGSLEYWIWFFGLTGFGSSDLLDLVLRIYWIWFFGLTGLVLQIYWILGFLRLDIVAIINDDTKIVNKKAGL